MNERTNETTKVKKNASSAKPTERENPFASCLRTCCAPFWWWWGNAIHGPFYTTEGDVTFSPPSLKRKNFVWFFGRNRECFIQILYLLFSTSYKSATTGGAIPTFVIFLKIQKVNLQFIVVHFISQKSVT
jgi:hypothetical protein